MSEAVNICLISSFITFLIQMLLIWRFAHRKSDLQTTIIDLVNFDTIALHFITGSICYIVASLTYETRNTPTLIPHILIEIFSAIFYFFCLCCSLYYSIGITIRYILVLKQRTYLIETYTDPETRNHIRCIVFGLSLIVVILRIIFGELPTLYYIITHTEGTDYTGIPLLIMVLSVALVVNIVFRTLIELENKKKEKVSRNSQLRLQTRICQDGVSINKLGSCHIGWGMGSDLSR